MPSLVKIWSELLVNTQNKNNQFDPEIASLRSGGFVIAWCDYSGTLGDSNGSSIKAQVFGADGTKVGREFLVNTQTASFQMLPSITALANGGFAVTWEDLSGTLGDSSASSIKAQVFAADGTKDGGEFCVNTETASDQYSPTITALANGGFVVTWCDKSGTLGDSSASSIKAQVFAADGTKDGGEFRVNTETASDQYNPTITALANGGFVVTWQGFSGTLGDSNVTSISAQVFGADGTKNGDEFRVNTLMAGSQSNPIIIGLRNGGFVVTWQDESGTLEYTDATSISAQVFGADGTKVGSEFHVNASTAGNNYKPTITGISNGDFVVAWWGYDGASADNSSIKAQIFAVNYDPVITSNGGLAAATILLKENDRAVSIVTAADADLGTALVYKIAGGSDAALFRIDSSNGALSFKTAPNFEVPADAGQNNVYDVVVQASDGALTDNQAIAVTVANVINELLVGTSRADILSGAEGNDTLKGLIGDDTLKGEVGSDKLYGGAGADRMFGGAGKDTLTGGSGQDTFVFDTAPTRRDTITDFCHAQGDKIQFGKAVFTGFAYTGTLHAEDFYAAAGATTAQDASDRVIYNTTTGVLYYDADGLGGAAAVQVALLGASTHPTLIFVDLQVIA